MIIKRFESEAEWLEARRGKITGTIAKEVLPKVRGTGYRSGFYQLIADKIAIPRGDENVMERGKSLEQEAIDRFMKETGKKVKRELVLCISDFNEDIAYSPDGLIGKTADVEVKCLNSGAHIEAWLTQKVPSEYESQIIQGFVVNPKLKTRYMVFYDPTCPKDMFYLTLNRNEYEKQIKEYFDLEIAALAEINKIIEQITF